MTEDLEARLKSHARSFDSLLSLIPAKLYYGEDNSDQWKRQKQTPEQKRAAKMAKLDPDNWKSAKDVADEREAAALKRKRDSDDESADTDTAHAEKPKHERWMARKKAEQQKLKDDTPSQKSKSPAKSTMSNPEGSVGGSKNDDDGQGEEQNDEAAEPIEIDETSFPQSNDLAEHDRSDHDASDESKQEEVFSPLHDSGTSSTSSIQAPSLDPLSKTISSPEMTSKLPKSEALLPQLEPKSQPTTALQPNADPKTRLQAALSAFKSSRTPSNPANLLGSPRSPIFHPPSPESNTSFSFGRIALPDGSAFSADGISAQPKRKGPQDPRTALAAAQAKQARIAGLDAGKRETIESKKLWANARKRAAGEKVRDDTSLLKKALKRHDAQKRKSEKEWHDRQDGVKKSIEMRQKKRTENLAKRRDEKSAATGKGQKGGGGAKVRRPGFEGSLRGRTGRSSGKKKN
ncbi:hypothetical protein DV736_g3040, partial [Chaetothyriales sp. CBS 134916]